MPAEQSSYIEYPPAVLRVSPNAIPRVIDALDRTLAELSPHLIRMYQLGRIPEPWLGDPMSARVQQAYNRNVMDAADGPYAALRAYEQQLVAARDALAQAEERYRRTEGENSDMWGRLA